MTEGSGREVVSILDRKCRDPSAATLFQIYVIMHTLSTKMPHTVNFKELFHLLMCQERDILQTMRCGGEKLFNEDL